MTQYPNVYQHWVGEKLNKAQGWLVTRALSTNDWNVKESLQTFLKNPVFDEKMLEYLIVHGTPGVKHTLLVNKLLTDERLLSFPQETVMGVINFDHTLELPFPEMWDQASEDLRYQICISFRDGIVDDLGELYPRFLHWLSETTKNDLTVYQRVRLAGCNPQLVMDVARNIGTPPAYAYAMYHLPYNFNVLPKEWVLDLTKILEATPEEKTEIVAFRRVLDALVYLTGNVVQVDDPHTCLTFMQILDDLVQFLWPESQEAQRSHVRMQEVKLSFDEETFFERFNFEKSSYQEVVNFLPSKVALMFKSQKYTPELFHRHLSELVANPDFEFKDQSINEKNVVTVFCRNILMYGAKMYDKENLAHYIKIITRYHQELLNNPSTGPAFAETLYKTHPDPELALYMLFSSERTAPDAGKAMLTYASKVFGENQQLWEIFETFSLEHEGTFKTLVDKVLLVNQ